MTLDTQTGKLTLEIYNRREREKKKPEMSDTVFVSATLFIQQICVEGLPSVQGYHDNM